MMKTESAAERCEIEAVDVNHTIQTRSSSHPFKVWSRDEPEAESENTTPSTTTRTRHVLKNVTFNAKPHEILAIAGPSGAGKSTLLDILSGKLTPKSGTIYVNKKPYSRSILKKVSGYVTQRDLLFPLLTVRETLTFGARLRIGRHDRARVEALIQELGLGHVADTRVGDSEGKVRGLSGGERRRVSIGAEVVHDPRVLILDEPTSGLDSNSATQVVGMVKGMAERHGRTVVMSVHQPGFRIVEMIDSVLVLEDGAVAYFGRMERLEMSLMEAGLRLPVQVNVLEFAIDSVDVLKLRARSVCERDRCTLEKLFLLNKVADDESEVTSTCRYELSYTYANSRLTETGILAHRFLKNVFRTKELFACRTIQMLISGVILGSIFFDLKDDGEGIRERVGLFAFILTFLLSSTTEALPIFLQEREILMKETSNGTYRVSSYVIANALVFVPFLLILSILFSMPLYWLVGLNPRLDAFFFFVLLIWLILYTANSVVVCFGALVPNFIVGNSLIAGVMGSFFLFSGYFIRKEAMPSYWVFMHYMSLFKYPFEGLLVNEFGGEGRCLEYEMGVCLMDGDDLLRQQGLGEEKRWKDLVVILGFISGFRVMSYVILRLRYDLDKNGGIKRALR